MLSCRRAKWLNVQIFEKSCSPAVGQSAELREVSPTLATPARKLHSLQPRISSPRATFPDATRPSEISLFHKNAAESRAKEEHWDVLWVSMMPAVRDLGGFASVGRRNNFATTLPKHFFDAVMLDARPGITATIRGRVQKSSKIVPQAVLLILLLQLALTPHKHTAPIQVSQDSSHHPWEQGR